MGLALPVVVLEQWTKLFCMHWKASVSVQATMMSLEALAIVIWASK